MEITDYRFSKLLIGNQNLQRLFQAQPRYFKISKRILKYRTIFRTGKESGEKYYRLYQFLKKEDKY